MSSAFCSLGPLLASNTNTLIAPALICMAGVVCMGLQSRGLFKTAIAMYVWVLWFVSLPVLQQAGWIHPEPVTNPWSILWAQVVILMGGFLAFRLVLGAYQQHVLNVQLLNASLGEKIDALSRQETALRESEQRVSQILQASPLPMLVTEFERGTCLEINPAWERSFERARADVLGRTAVELGMWRDESLRHAFKQQFSDQGRVEGFEVRHELPGGGVRTLLLSSERFSYGGQACVLTISIDVTERKLLE